VLADLIREIRELSISERKMLLMIIADSLTETAKTRSLLELEGLGAELWEGIDAQAYVDSLRSEWDERES
jgi:hypothetical protein